MVHELRQARVGPHRAAAQTQVDDTDKGAEEGGAVAAPHHQHDAERLLLSEQIASPDGEPVEQEVRVPGVLHCVVV